MPDTNAARTTTAQDVFLRRLGRLFPDHPADVLEVASIELADLARSFLGFVAAENGLDRRPEAEGWRVVEILLEGAVCDDAAIAATIPDEIPRNDPAYEVARFQRVLESCVGTPADAWDGQILSDDERRRFEQVLARLGAADFAAAARSSFGVERVASPSGRDGGSASRPSQAEGFASLERHLREQVRTFGAHKVHRWLEALAEDLDGWEREGGAPDAGPLGGR